ncbi:MAG: co-chaperone GroES family protein [Bacteroidales bacterium]|nr:co-chaperone GroES family protein [Bacteroidales bacterium]
METSSRQNGLENLIVIGDRVLIQPGNAAKRTKSGLYLPAGYQEKEEVQSGFILKCGPGYAIPNMEAEESWNPKDQELKYMPLQVQPGDLALFMLKSAVEIKYNGEKYFIVPQSAILLVERDEF